MFRSTTFSRGGLFSFALTLLLWIPVLAALESLPFFSHTDDPAHLASRAERILSYLFFLLATIFLFRKPLHSDEHDYSENSNIFKHSITAYVLIALPGIPFLFRNLLYPLEAFHGLYLGDFDYTNISQTLNLTSMGYGLLPTPHVTTGSGGSFLGHHFSPSLLVFLPFYLIAHGAAAVFHFRPDHLIYGELLFVALLSGWFFWARLIQLKSTTLFSAVLSSAVLANSIFLWRLGGSFHFEALVLLFSALSFLSYSRKGVLFWFSLFLWMGIKEDIAIYIFLWGLYGLITGKKVFHLQRSSRIMLISFVFFVFALMLKHFFSGGTGPDWSSYWNDFGPVGGSIKSIFVALLSFGLFSLFSVRLTLIVLFPVTLFHYFSGHPWHSNFIAHYSYTLLPHLMLATILG